MNVTGTSGGDVVAAIGAELVLGTVGELPAQVVDVTHDSRQVTEDSIFACVPGSSRDGHDFAAEAVAAGSTMLIVERRLEGLGVAQVLVRDVRRAMASAARAVHGDPASTLTMVAVTGTNGKTTTAHLIGSILASAGRSVRVLGTLSGARTTPEATDLHRALAGLVRTGVDTVVMEVSSHALTLHRVDGVVFDVAVFTNLGRDHLDLHGSMEAYFLAKAALFAPSMARLGVTNLDDPFGRRLEGCASIRMVGYRPSELAHVSIGVADVGFEWRGRAVVVPLGGSFNVSNALAALVAVEALGLEPDEAISGLATAAPVPGRFESIGHPSSDFAVIVDYAHTPDGLDEVLRAARSVGDRRVIVVFGCGGDRDREKRPEMGAVAADLADVVVVTSDNPRSEDPMSIIDQIVDGVPADRIDRVAVEVDRRTAIDRAITQARTGDVVVIAGKGHEATQVVAGVEHEFDDRVVAREALGRRGTP
ncbi:MAG: UDP-N-acetylmuramoyl-L-alanyl-D-glutamate--2,6-diaminopimelate ligase [Ilumatobacteraceae bacterium]